MILKQKVALISVFFFTYHFSIAQDISVISDTPFESYHKINKIYNSTTLGETVFVLADMRDKSGFIDMLLLKMNKEGVIEKEISIGMEQTSESPIGMFEKDGEYFILINRITTYSKAMRLYKLSKDLEILDVEYLEVKNLLEGKSMIYNPKSEVLTISTIVKDKYEHIYPHILEYDISDKKVLSHIEIAQINDSTIFDRAKKLYGDSVKVKSPIFNDKGEFVRNEIQTISTKGVDQNIRVQWTKTGNSLSFVDEDLSQIAVVGYETTSSFTDFWVAGIQQGRLYWEKIYKSELGGDEAYDVYNTADALYVLGLDYNKTNREDGNYGYKILVLDKRGEVLYENRFRKAMRSMYKKGIQLNEDHFFIMGQAQDLIYPEHILGEEKLTVSNIWLVLTDEKGEQIGELYHETDRTDIALHMAKVSDEEAMVFYMSDDTLKLLRVQIKF